ncbi:hypothetical protein AB0M68_01820 [Streptomyces sp. NPDC051453]|uniref:hypothetical protein n=1 Tax=Streptomyces sp. NPDC051453 TaxID=3154941 RepID=UPI003441C339
MTLTLGDTIGYLDGTGAHLLVSSGGDELLSVSVGVDGSGGPVMKGHPVRANAATLAAATGRHAAQDIRQCVDAENLPDGEPDIG